MVISIELLIAASAAFISEFHELVSATEDFYNGTDMIIGGGDDLNDKIVSRKRIIDVLNSWPSL